MRHQLAVGGARDLDVSHSPGDVGDASSTPDDAAKNGCTVVLSPGETGIAFHWPLRNAPSGELERLEQLMARPIKELKEILKQRRIDASDCFEKGDLARKIVATCANVTYYKQ